MGLYVSGSILSLGSRWTLVGQPQYPSCLTECRDSLYQIKARGIGGLKEGMTDGADTVMLKIIEDRSSGHYLARARIIYIFFS